MSDNSIQNLFKSGITKEQYLNQHKEVTSKGGEFAENSIFGKTMSGSVGNIFDAVDTNHDGKLDDNELALLKAKGKDDDTTVLSDKDISTVYDEIQAAQQQQASASDADFQINFNNIINGFIQNSNASSQLRSEYSSKSSELNNLEREIDKNKKDIEAKNKEKTDKEEQIKQKEAEISSAQQELEQLQKDPEKNKSAISEKQNQISSLDSEIQSLKSDISNLDKEISSLNDKLSQNQNRQLTLQDEIQELEQQIASADRATQQAMTSFYGSSQYTSSFSNNNNKNHPSMDGLAAEGLEYDTSAGARLAQDMAGHATGFEGHCARFVSNGLERVGLSNGQRANATDMDTVLDNNKNFRAIKVGSQEELRNLPAGCVVVYERGAAGYNKTYGHIEVTLGNGHAASDGVTRNMRYSENMTVYVPVKPKAA